MLKTFGTRFHAGCLGHSRRGTEHWILKCLRNLGSLLIRSNRFSKYWSPHRFVSKWGMPQCMPHTFQPDISPKSSALPLLSWFLRQNLIHRTWSMRAPIACKGPYGSTDFQRDAFHLLSQSLWVQRGPSLISFGRCKTPRQCIKRPRDSETRSRWQFRTFHRYPWREARIQNARAAGCNDFLAYFLEI